MYVCMYVNTRVYLYICFFFKKGGTKTKFYAMEKRNNTCKYRYEERENNNKNLAQTDFSLNRDINKYAFVLRKIII